MPSGKAKCEGLKKLPNVPYYAGEMAPMLTDTDFAKGPLQDRPRDPIYRVMDFGGPRTASGGTGSPASATFAAGRPNLERMQKEPRVMPETQLPGSYNTSAGQGAPVVSAIFRGRGRRIIKDGD